MMAETCVMWPPVAFGILLVTSLVVLWLLGRLSMKVKNKPKGATKAYACGEDLPSHMLQPDYGQFLPFAFFFTILHVVALTVTTVPTESVATFVMAFVYILGAIVGLCVLYSK